MPSLITSSKIVPTMWNELSMLGPAFSTNTRTARPPAPGWMVLVLVRDAIADHVVRSRGRSRRLVEADGAGLLAQVPLALDQEELVIDRGEAPGGSTMIMPNMPLAM